MELECTKSYDRKRNKLSLKNVTIGVIAVFLIIRMDCNIGDEVAIYILQLLGYSSIEL
jgi:hypothetical protein